MKIKRTQYLFGFLLISFGIGLSYQSCTSSQIPLSYSKDTLITNLQGQGDVLEIIFERGAEHNHPLMAIWVTDTNMQYIQTLYVAESIAKGVFGHGDNSSGKWLPGPIRRPAALPVWSHTRGIREADGYYIPTQATAMPDAYTGATPPSHFLLQTKTDAKLPATFHIYFEINQTWDWNNYWTNNKYPDDENYKTSCQPALVYHARVNSKEKNKAIELALIGHSHYNGSDGSINPDLSTITSARDITKSIQVKLNP